MNLWWPIAIEKCGTLTKLTSDKEGDLQEHWHLCYQKRNYRVSSQPVKEKPSSMTTDYFPIFVFEKIESA